MAEPPPLRVRSPDLEAEQAGRVFEAADPDDEPELSRHFMVTGRPRRDVGLDANALDFEGARALALLTGWEVRADPMMSVYRECLAAGGTVFGDAPWSFSARGAEVDVSAPARKVPVAAVENGLPPKTRLGHHTGTSFSVALVAGIAALWLAHHGRERLISRLEGAGLQ